MHNILSDPIYAGAYAFRRTKSTVSVVDGRKRVRHGVRRPPTEWDVPLQEQHAAYISWEQFESNQRTIADNATGYGSAVTNGAVRQGEVLLAGLLGCGHCGSKLHVHYNGNIGRYQCNGVRTTNGTSNCISIGSTGIDAAASTEALRVLRPLGIDAAIKAIASQSHETSATQRQLELALRQARFEAAHARRQYDAVDPANRLVASEL